MMYHYERKLKRKKRQEYPFEVSLFEEKIKEFDKFLQQEIPYLGKIEKGSRKWILTCSINQLLSQSRMLLSLCRRINENFEEINRNYENNKHKIYDKPSQVKKRKLIMMSGYAKRDPKQPLSELALQLSYLRLDIFLFYILLRRQFDFVLKFISYSGKNYEKNLPKSFSNFKKNPKKYSITQHEKTFIEKLLEKTEFFEEIKKDRDDWVHQDTGLSVAFQKEGNTKRLIFQKVNTKELRKPKELTEEKESQFDFKNLNEKFSQTVDLFELIIQNKKRLAKPVTN